MRIKVLYIVTLLFIFAIQSLSQNITSDKVLAGIKLFYEARFDESTKILRQLVEEKSITGEDLFAANLYTAFSLIRQEASPDLVQEYFSNAIYVNPQIPVDNSRIPPDLYEEYLNARLATLGTLVVRSEPSAASILMYHQSSDQILRRNTPLDLRDLMIGSYELVIAKEGYLPQTAKIELKPNQSDTLFILLEEKESSLVKKYWPWAGGFVVATSVLLSRLFDRDEEATKETTLPAPPARPGNP